MPRDEGATRLVAELSIAASPEQVWAILVDFDAYSEWNAWLPELHGEAVEGGTATARVRLDDNLRRARHRVLEVDARAGCVGVTPGRRRGLCGRSAAEP